MTLWRDGRFAWPLVVFVVYMTLSLVIVDFVWRRFVMPFETLLIFSVLADGAVGVVLILMCLRFRGAGARP
jgi:hypothetical protein